MMTRKFASLCFVALTLLVACAPAPPSVPTLARLPTDTLSIESTRAAILPSPSVPAETPATPAPLDGLATPTAFTPTILPTGIDAMGTAISDALTATQAARATIIPPSPSGVVNGETPLATPSPYVVTRVITGIPPTAAPTLPPTETPTITLTPSLTITATLTPIIPTATRDLGGLGLLAILAEGVTVVPPEQRIPAPTLTAFFAARPPPASVSGGVVIALPTVAACPYPPPIGIAASLSADPGLNTSLGCPVSLATTTGAGAVQYFERGLMLYVGGAPNLIYALFNDGQFRVYADSWIAGVDPESGGQVPPPGLIEPIRGFGKAWRSDAEARALLGWAISVESGGTAAAAQFERGRVITLSALGQTIALINSPNGLSGLWQSITGGL